MSGGRCGRSDGGDLERSCDEAGGRSATTPIDQMTPDQMRERVIAEIKLLATPLDFDDLIGRGILKKASANWYWLLVPLKELPDGFGRRIAAAASSPKGMRVRFWSAKAAARVAHRLGI